MVNQVYSHSHEFFPTTLLVADAWMAVPAAVIHPGEAGGHLTFQPAAPTVSHLK